MFSVVRTRRPIIARHTLIPQMYFFFFYILQKKKIPKMIF